MMDIRGELGHEIQMPGLSGRMTVVVGLEGEDEWPMILHEMPEVPDSQIHHLSNVLYLVSASCSFLEK